MITGIELPYQLARLLVIIFGNCRNRTSREQEISAVGGLKIVTSSLRLEERSFSLDLVCKFRYVTRERERKFKKQLDPFILLEGTHNDFESFLFHWLCDWPLLLLVSGSIVMATF